MLRKYFRPFNPNMLETGRLNTERWFLSRVNIDDKKGLFEHEKGESWKRVEHKLNVIKFGNISYQKFQIDL